MPADSRRGLVSFVESLGFPDPNKLGLRPDGSQPHPYLALQPGAACRQCAFRSTSVDLVRCHLVKVHGLKGTRQA